MFTRAWDIAVLRQDGSELIGCRSCEIVNCHFVLIAFDNNLLLLNMTLLVTKAAERKGDKTSPQVLLTRIPSPLC